MIYAGILAGGSGRRMHAATPKQFLPLEGKTVLQRTLDKFIAVGTIDEIFVAVPYDYLDFARDMLKDYNKKVTLVEGGADRNGSILAIIDEIRKHDADDGSILITHDAARPFVDGRIIRENIDTAKLYGVADTVIPATDTIMRSADGEYVSDVLERQELFNTQTPQTFRIGWFIEDYARLSEREKKTMTDACGVFVKNGRSVKLVRGAEKNIKLTTPLDMILARAMIQNGEE